MLSSLFVERLKNLKDRLSNSLTKGGFCETILYYYQNSSRLYG
jgi:hypothetical protein